MTTKQQKFNQKFQQLRAEVISKTQIPADKVVGGFFECLHQSMLFNSLFKSQLPLESWRNLALLERDLFFPEMDIAIAMVQASTPDEFNMTVKEHLEKVLIGVVHPMIQMMNQLDGEVCAPIKSKLAAEMKLHLGDDKRIIQLGEA